MKQVYISCAFWDDDWVNELDPSEKLFYLYLITNTNNNLIGIYKMPKKKIRYDTGFSSEVVTLLLDRFENQYKKIYYIDDHIFLKNMVKNQALNSPKLVLGMKNTLNSLPDKLKILFLLEIAKQGYWSVFKGVSIPYGYPMDTLSIQYGYSMDTVRILCDTPPVNINQNLNQNIKSKSSNQKENLKENENTLCDCVADDDFLRSDFENGCGASSADVVVTVNKVSDFKKLTTSTKKNPVDLIKAGGILEPDEYCQISKKDIPDIMDIYASKFPEVREILGTGLNKVKLFELMRSYPLAELTAMMWKAKESATSNPVGYFMKLVQETEPNNFEYDEQLPKLEKIIFKLFDKHGYKNPVFQNVEAL